MARRQKSGDNPRHISWWPELPPSPRLSVRSRRRRWPERPDLYRRGLGGDNGHEMDLHWAERLSTSALFSNRPRLSETPSCS